MILTKFKDLFPTYNDYFNEFSSLFHSLDTGETMDDFIVYYYKVVNTDYDNAYFRYESEAINKHISQNIKDNIPYLYMLYKLWKYYYKGEITIDEVTKVLSLEYTSTQASTLAQEYTNHRKNLVAQTPTTNYSNDGNFVERYANEGAKDDGNGTFDQDTTKDYQRDGGAERIFKNLRYIPKVISNQILESVSELFIPYYNLDLED